MGRRRPGSGLPLTRFQRSNCLAESHYLQRNRYWPGVCISSDRVASLPALTKEILRYFLEHPEATDDLEGISRWRLRQKNSERSISEVNQALQWLVERDISNGCSRAARARRFGWLRENGKPPENYSERTSEQWPLTPPSPPHRKQLFVCFGRPSSPHSSTTHSSNFRFSFRKIFSRNFRPECRCFCIGFITTDPRGCRCGGFCRPAKSAGRICRWTSIFC